MAVMVRLVGTFAAGRTGEPGVLSGLGSRKARRLVALLAVHRGAVVPTDRISGVLWPGTAPRRPQRDLATLVSRVRSALGPETIVGGGNGYRLGSSPGVQVDLDEAVRLLAETERQLAAGAPGLAAAAAGRALELLDGGAVLADEPDADWVLDARAGFEILLRSVRHAAATAALRRGEASTAQRVSQAALIADRFDEAAHRLLMSAHQAAGEPSRAVAAYARLRSMLAAELGIDPAPETRAVHQAILREQTPALPGPATPGPPHRDVPALVGRAEHLVSLAGAWTAACAGSPALVLIAGEGGIGKTRLASAMVATAEATGGQVLQARCYVSERSLFLQPVVDALSGPVAALPSDRLRDLAGARAGALTGLLPDLADVLGPESLERRSPEMDRRQIYEAVTLVLRGLATERPALLLLDDLHNAGSATVELLHYLARHLERSRLLVLATVRAEEGGAALDALAEVSTRIDVGPLSPDAVTRLAHDAGQGGLAGVILRRTRGHTLFVVETLRGLTAGETGVPGSLQAVVLARLRRAGADTEELLRAGAVLGSSVDLAAIAAMLNLGPHVVAQRCAQAAAARLLIVADRDYEFANDLVREVLYATTPLPMRLALHRRAADLLTGAPELVAAHAVAIEDWPRAARAFLRCGDQAMRRCAAADAEALFGQALQAAERAADAELIARCYLARGRAREVQGAYRGAIGDQQAAVAAARRGGDRRVEMLALRELGGHAAPAVGISVQECAVRLRDGLRIAESLGDRGIEADLLGRLSIVAANRLHFTEALDLSLRAVRAGRAARSDRALAAALDGRKHVHAALGDSGPFGDVFDELEPLLRRGGDLKLLQWAVFESALLAVGRADWNTVRLRIDEAVVIGERSGYQFVPWFVAHLGWVARLEGRMEEAVDHGRRAVAAAACVTDRWFRPGAEAMLAGTLLELGDLPGATDLLRAALAHVERDGAEAYLLRCLAPLAEATGDRGVLADADTLLAGISAPPESAWLLGVDCYLSVARAWRDQGEPGRGRAVLAPLLDAARRLEWVPVFAAAGLVDALAGIELGDPTARDAVTRVVELASVHGMAGVERVARRALSRTGSGGVAVARTMPSQASGT